MDFKSNSFCDVGSGLNNCKIYPQKGSSSAFVYYNESKSEFKTGQKLIEILNGFKISMLTPTCITKEQIQEILDLHNIKYTWDNESGIFSQIDGNDCYINPLHFDGNQPVPACFLYLHLTFTFSTSEILIGLLRNHHITMTGSNAQWMAIGRLATLVETLSRTH
jgi:hypothetical protein